MSKKAQSIYIPNIMPVFLKRVGRAHKTLHSRFFLDFDSKYNYLRNGKENTLHHCM